MNGTVFVILDAVGDGPPRVPSSPGRNPYGRGARTSGMDFSGAVIDVDGTVVRGDDPIPGAPAAP